MTVEAIKAAIEQLTEQERRALADWLEKLEDQAWDAEMERDFSPSGRGQDLVEKINQEIAKNKFTPLEMRGHIGRIGGQTSYAAIFSTVDVATRRLGALQTQRVDSVFPDIFLMKNRDPHPRE